MPDSVWLGEETLAVALDIGTTQSAASIVHLVPNQPFTVRGVTKWPSSPNSSKIPTVILYDEDGTPEAIGAQTNDDSFADRKLTECKWFKLHLHPAAMQPPPYDAMPGGTVASAFEVPPLPTNVLVEEAYSDFIKYLFDNTKIWFESNEPDGHAVWKNLEKKNQDRVVFVTESEASVHFTLFYSAKQQSQWLAPQSTFAVVDAGGSTVDICVYNVLDTQPKLKLREAKTSDCTQSGGIFVSRAAEEVIKAKLGASRFNEPEFVRAMVNIFDTKTKLIFDSVEDNYIIKFGFDRDTDLAAGITRGRLTLTGEEVKRAFEPCVKTILQSLREQTAGLRVSSILLVGGFGESPYLLRRIREEFAVPGTRVVTADEPAKKAVSEGGCLFFATESVVGRGTRFEFGIAVARDYAEWAHKSGNRVAYVTANGSMRFSGGWTCIVPHGAIVDTTEVHRRSFRRFFAPTDSLKYSVDVMTFSGVDGSTAHNGWSQDETGAFHDGFVKCCTVCADLTLLAATMPWTERRTERRPEPKPQPVVEPQAKSGKFNWGKSIKPKRLTEIEGPSTPPPQRWTETGPPFKDLHFDICLLVGGTSLKAEVRWKVNGTEYTGPASIIPASFL